MKSAEHAALMAFIRQQSFNAQVRHDSRRDEKVKAAGTLVIPALPREPPSAIRDQIRSIFAAK